ncbi:MAG TPA: glycoside hydrolase domain-containing protein [Pyrinomonadaceae bacterium]|nr:glycoside hydrolase domain-containing protein [Pyrinomonadaceae bacterium]
MRKILFILLSAVFSIVFLGLNWQPQQAQENITFNLATGNTVRELKTTFQEPYFKDRNSQTKSSNIKNIQVIDEKTGVAFTADSLFRTDDNGENWREITLPREFDEVVSGVSFGNKFVGWVILADLKNTRLMLAKTEDGGINWVKIPVNLKPEHLQEANLSKIDVIVYSADTAGLMLYLASSSNFVRQIIYKTGDEGQSWNPTEESMTKKVSDSEPSEKIDGENVIRTESYNSNRWFLTGNGKCEGFKTGCWQETKIYTSNKEITPPQISELSRIEKLNAKLQAGNSVFATAPNGTTRISLNRGFDKCTAATSAQMQTWWNSSPFYDVNIYLSGRNRGCSQAQLTAAWVNSVTAQGWGLIPTVVGYQSPCTASTTSAKFSTDPAVAEQQGRGEADIAIADANNLGLTQGTVLYYDMERYDDLSGTGACSTPTKAFLKGWTDRLKELGYKSGVYGSPFNAQGDWINMPQASQPDIVWLARWNNVMSVWGVAPLPDTFWTNHQRIHQWLGPQNETWGGVTFNIDNNISDAPVAGLAIAKNKRADFDGDGKSDVSVWRPETGVWYIANSSNSGYTILNFGQAGDILAPGDYDGDGKTDFAVWRPETGVWHLYSRSIYRSFAFGANGDIPVPADYDGDGRTDAAVYRPSEGVWYIWNSFDSRGTSYTIQQFGISGDKPVPGDYDGDGKTDIAIYRPSVGEWWIQRSSNASVYAFRFGTETDKPVTGDYTGDGKTDAAFWRPVSGEWFILRSEDSSFYSVPFGASGDIAASGDFDGDNKSDIAVFRPETGVWYVSQSQAGVMITQFGISTDRPIAAAYTP